MISRALWIFMFVVSSTSWAQAAPSYQRIVTLAPSLAEIVFEYLDGADRIVGVADGTNYPPKLSSKPKVGPFHRPSVEKILSLDPDLIIATKDGNPKETVEKLRALGRNVELVDTHTIEGVREAISSIGIKLGIAGESNPILRHYDARWSEIKKRALARSGIKAPSVLLQLGYDPLVVAGPESFLGGVLNLIGAKNAYADLKASYPRPQKEDVIGRKPDLAIYARMGGEPVELKTRLTRYWAELKIPFVWIDAEELTRPSPRFLEGVQKLESAIYPTGGGMKR